MTTNIVPELSYLELLREIWGRVRKHIRKIAISSGVALVVSLLELHFTPLVYTANVMVAPSETISGSSPVSALSSLSALTGDKLGDTSQSFQPFLQFTQTLSSTTVADALTKRPWVMPSVFAGQWDSEKKHWRTPFGIQKVIKGMFKAVIGGPPRHDPNADDLSRQLNRMIKVEKFGRNPAYTISLSEKEPKLANDLLLAVWETNNEIIQNAAKDRFLTSTEYLKTRLNTETQIDRKSVLNQLLLQQEGGLMAAEAKGAYAAKIIMRPWITVSIANKVKSAIIAFILVFVIVFLALYMVGLEPSRKKIE